MEKKRRFLNTPSGTKPFYMSESLFRSEIVKLLSDYFSRWGFVPITPPIIDYYDIYENLLSDDLLKGSLKFVDRNGDVILLRNDIALFCAKLVASRLSSNNSMFRYFYSDTIIRGENNNLPEEYYQIGCELVGEEFSCQEIELITILLESAKCLNINDSVLHIGDISFYKMLLKDIDDISRSDILEAIRNRDKAGLKQLLDAINIEENIKKDCLLASTFIGTFREMLKLPFSDKGKEALSNIKNIGSVVTKIYENDEIIFDLSELSKLKYYDGIVFKLYSKVSGTVVASGGRYDLVYKKLGMDKKSVGFSYYLQQLEKILDFNSFIKEKSVEKIGLDKSDIKKTFVDSIEKVKSNKNIEIVY